LKLENFLFDEKDSNHLKLIDFGFSKLYDPNVKMAICCGTLDYMAPEVLKKNYTSQCDLWSLGVIVFILLAGYMPFSGSELTQVAKIKKGHYYWNKARWQGVSSSAIDFVKKLIVVDASTRLTASQALEHPWIVNRESHKSESVDQATVDALCSFAEASLFRRKCMYMMAWSLSNEERAKVRDIFIAMDKDKTGTIKLNELRKVLEENFEMSAEQSELIFKALDSNHDDEIHYADFLAAMVSSRINIHQDMVWKAFKRFDTDNSGEITMDNLKAIMGGTFTDAEIGQLVEEVDVNKDGKIQYSEFVDYVAHDSSANYGTEIVGMQRQKRSSRSWQRPTTRTQEDYPTARQDLDFLQQEQ